MSLSVTFFSLYVFWFESPGLLRLLWMPDSFPSFARLSCGVELTQDCHHVSAIQNFGVLDKTQAVLKKPAKRLDSVPSLPRRAPAGAQSSVLRA